MRSLFMKLSISRGSYDILLNDKSGKECTYTYWSELDLMGNTLCCPIKTAEIEISLDGVKNVTVKDVLLPGTRVGKLKFVLPIIKVTDDKNNEYLIFHPERKENGDCGLAKQGSDGKSIGQKLPMRYQRYQKSKKAIESEAMQSSKKILPIKKTRSLTSLSNFGAMAAMK